MAWRNGGKCAEKRLSLNRVLFSYINSFYLLPKKRGGFFGSVMVQDKSGHVYKGK